MNLLIKIGVTLWAIFAICYFLNLSLEKVWSPKIDKCNALIGAVSFSLGGLLLAFGVAVDIWRAP